MVADAYLGDPQDPVQAFNISFHLTVEPVGSTGNPARLQRAPKGADQSPRRSGDNMVQGGGILHLRLETVEIADTAVYPIIDRIGKSLDEGPPYGTLIFEDPGPAGMDETLAVQSGLLRFRSTHCRAS